MQDTTKCDLKATGWQSMEWGHLAHSRDQRWDLLNVVMQLGVPVDAAVILPSSAKSDLFKTDCSMESANQPARSISYAHNSFTAM